MELAQLICDRSREMSTADEPQDVGAAALSLMRTSGNDGTTLDHASVIFRTRLRDDPADETSRAGLRLLTRVQAFLRRPSEGSD